MIDIKGLGPGMPVPQEDSDRERMKEIKSRAGKVAFTAILGGKGKVSHVSQGIARSEGALKWIEQVLEKDKWKDS